jgi:hypothetical protein
VAPDGNSRHCGEGRAATAPAAPAGGPLGVPRAAWVAAAGLAVVLLGPVLGPGSLLTLDLVVTDPVPVPRGVWGLGPELPRRVPLWVPLAWLSPLVSGEALGKALLALCIALAFAGAYRLADRLAHEARLAGDGLGLVPWAASGAALVYAASPFLLTRLAVGHLMVAVPVALLPWFLPVLLDPGRSPARTFLAALALGIAGPFGAALAVVTVVVGLAATRARRAAVVIGAVLVAQLPWLVPGVVVAAAGSRPVDAAPFATRIDGVAGLFGLVLGQGFWQRSFVFGNPVVVGLGGATVLALAGVGLARLPPQRRWPLLALAGVGLVGAAATAVPGLRDGVAAVTRLPGAGVLREGQRVLALALVVLAPAAAVGALVVARRVTGQPPAGPRTGSEPPGDRADADGGPSSRPGPLSPVRAAMATATAAVLLAVGVAVATPAVWGIDPRLRPVELPASWYEARAAVEAAPGTVLALPWHQYYDLPARPVRRVLNPVPLFLGGDVLTSSDPELGQPDRRERSDPREPTADDIVVRARGGRPVAADLAALGVRWVFIVHAVDWADLRGIGPDDPGLRPVVRSAAVDLWEVRAWRGLVVAAGGTVPTRPVVEPLLLADPSDDATVARPGAGGWHRGRAGATVAPDGQLALPAGTGPVWYWPTLVVLAGDLAAAVATGLAGAGALADRRRGRAGWAGGDPGHP